MSAKVHLHMHVSDLAKSRGFYGTFFGAAPVKEKPGYVKFLPEWAPVNLALSTGHPVGEGVVNHVGVQVDTPATVTSSMDFSSFTIRVPSFFVKLERTWIGISNFPATSIERDCMTCAPEDASSSISS